MRIRVIAAVAALLIVPASAFAQDPPTPSRLDPITKPFSLGFIDFGARGTGTTGDAARYERYRDLSDGLFLERVRLDRRQSDWLLQFDAQHVGYEDQRYIGTATKQGKFRGWFMWDQIPMLLSRTTRTFYQGDVLHNNGTLVMDDAIQSAGQTNANNIPLLFDANAQTFELWTKRHIAETGAQYLASTDLTFNGLFRYTNKDGAIPYGGSFGHSLVVETLMPVNYTTKDFDANAEWSRGRFLVRGGYTGSWLTNDTLSLTFDNPWRATDTSSASSRGRHALPPSNSFVGVNGMASVKLPWRSRATGYISSALLQDAGDGLIPQTVNTAITGVNPLPRSTVDGRARTFATNLSFTSRPTNSWDFQARYRSYDYDNQTPEFESFQKVPFDYSLSNLTTPIVTDPFSLTRQSFDGDARYLLMPGTTVGAGYTWLKEARTRRIFDHVTDNVFRATFDTLSKSWLSLRVKYEHAQRRGAGFDEHVLEHHAEQPGMRHMDLAPRDRDRVTLTGLLTPVQNLGITFSVAAGNDDYLESVMGIRDNNHRVYSGGFDWTPRENMAFGASYSRENYMALSRSRQANPDTPTGCVNVFPAPAGQVTCQFYDESRNWAADTDDRVHSFILYADFLNLWQRVDVRLNWDINRSTATYAYITGPVTDRTLPEETPGVPSTLPPPSQLPDVISDLDRGTVDLVYNFNKRIGLGFSYWYEKFNVQDWALDAESIGNQVQSNAVLLGYMYTPYTAQTGWVRLIVRW